MLLLLLIIIGDFLQRNRMHCVNVFHRGGPVSSLVAATLLHLPKHFLEAAFIGVDIFVVEAAQLLGIVNF